MGFYGRALQRGHLNLHISTRLGGGSASGQLSEKRTHFRTVLGSEAFEVKYAAHRAAPSTNRIAARIGVESGTVEAFSIASERPANLCQLWEPLMDQ